MSSGAAVGTKGVPRAEREGADRRRGHQPSSPRTATPAPRWSRSPRRAGISKPLIYQYFGSKDGLFLACLHAVSGGLLDRLQDAELEVDDTVASRIYPLRAIFEALEPQRDAWRMLFDPSMPGDGEIAAAAGCLPRADDQHRRERVGPLPAGPGQRQPVGRVALTGVWMGVVNSLVEWWLAHPEESAENMIARCYRLLAAILG